MIDQNEMTRRFLMGENKEDLSTLFHINAISEALKSLNPKTERQKRKLYEATSHLRHVKRKNRLTEEKLKLAEEKISLLEEQVIIREGEE